MVRPTFRTLDQLLDTQPRVAREGLLNENEYLDTLNGAAEVFAEASVRDMFPVVVKDDIGVLVSRKLKVVDMGAYLHGMKGSGGNFTKADKANDDQPAYALWENILVDERELAASRRNGGVSDLMTDSGRRAGSILTEGENEMLTSGVGPVTGITGLTYAGTPTTTQGGTFASVGAWTTAGDFWKDLSTARGRLGARKAPIGSLALAGHPTDIANAMNVFANTSDAQLEKARMLLPGGVYQSAFFTAGSAFFYCRTPTVVEYDVYQDLRVIPLPKIDLDERSMMRFIGALHFPRPNGIEKVTSVDA